MLMLLSMEINKTTPQTNKLTSKLTNKQIEME
jgi:hypothetical protein